MQTAINKTAAETKSKPLRLPANQVTGNYYRGINIVLLWSAAMKNKFATSEWASFKQWSSKKNMYVKAKRAA